MSFFDDASLLLIPSGYKDDKLYSIKPTDGAGDFTFSRDGSGASVATRINSSGLIEKGHTNQVLKSNNFGDGTWVQSATTRTSGQAGYDGTNDAWEITRSSSGAMALQQTQTLSGVYTFSIYVKINTANGIGLNFGSLGAGQYARFNISDADQTAAATEVGLIASTQTYVGNNFYRISITANTTQTSVRLYTTSADGTAGVSTGATYIIQDAQVQKGLIMTDYIETDAAEASAGLLGDMPRLDYSDGASCPHLLLERSRTNKFTFSEYFGASDWAKAGIGSGSAPVVTTNYAISPEGVKNASRVQFDAVGTSSGDRSTLSQSFAFTTGDIYTLSCWVKATSGSSTMFHMRINGAQVGGEKTATDEWQLFTETHTATATTTDEYGLQIRGNYSSNSSDILIYGMQLEAASSGSSYIPTHGAAVARGLDVPAFLTNVSTDGILNNYSSTIFVHVRKTLERIGLTRFAVLYSTSGNNPRILLYVQNSTSTFSLTLQYRVSGQTDVVQSLGTFNHGDELKMIFRLNGTELKTFVNGSPKLTSTIVQGDDVEKLGIYDNGDNGHQLVQYAAFPSSLSDEDCETLTTL